MRTLETSFAIINKSINAYLSKNDMTSAKSHTLLAALVFSALTEAKFSKLIHTPYAFDIGEIEEIKRQPNISSKWKKAVSIGIGNIKTSCKSNYKINLLLNIERLIETHITEPSKIRNKIAHGQWAKALNSDNTQVNTQLTTAVLNLDCVEVLKWKITYDHFYSIVNDIVQSPNKAHFRDYHIHVVELESYLKKAENYSLNDKISALQKKRKGCTEIVFT